MGPFVVQLAGVAGLCFLVGSVNPATLLARALGRDLRAAGSGNPCATNAGRVLGPKWGVLVLFLDVAKAWLPTVIVLRSMGTGAAIVAGTSVVLGHMFSPFLRGKGGKGVATFLGLLLALDWQVGLGLCLTWLVTAALVRVSSIAALVAASSLRTAATSFQVG